MTVHSIPKLKTKPQCFFHILIESFFINKDKGYTECQCLYTPVHCVPVHWSTAPRVLLLPAMLYISQQFVRQQILFMLNFIIKNFLQFFVFIYD